jgi:predicted TIM-barrel fold metal-dependent hydrolase
LTIRAIRWLLVGSACATACRDASPPVERPTTSIIDIHTHLGGVATWPGKTPNYDEIARAMQDRNVDLVVDFKAPGNSLDDGIYGERVSQRIATYPDTSRFKLFANVPMTAADDVFLAESRADYPQWIASILEDAVRRGAVGLKIKTQAGIGDVSYWMVDKHGVLVPFDSPKLDPLWETAARLRVPVLLHLGGAYKAEHQEPKGDKRSVRWEMLMLERERVVRRHPRLLMIGAHWGCTGDDPTYLDEMLRRYPNFFAEGGAHDAKDQFATLDSASLRMFDEFQDRLLFGTDYMENTFRWLKSYHQRLDMFLPWVEKWPLSDSVRAKYYHGNARRLLHRTGANSAPVANAGFTTTRFSRAEVILDGSGSYDVDGDTLTYRWRQSSGPPVALRDTMSARPRFTPSRDGEYTFELAVRDPSGAENKRGVRVNVVPDTNVIAMSNDVATVEAEHFANSISRNGSSWAVTATRAGFSGDGYVVANGGGPSGAAGEYLPNTFRTAAPELQYVVWFDTPGTYVIHARGIATDTTAGGINVGLDNEESRLADHVGPFSTSDWQWRHETREWDSQFDLLARNLTVLNVADAGPHIINVWPRRSGVMLDKLMIARETRSQVSFKLTDPGDGVGPAESQRRRAPR